MNRAFFFDRDGILNRVVMRGEKVSSPWHISEFEPIPEAQELVRLAKQNKFLTVLVTNQPDVSKGHIPQEQLELMHEKIRETFGIDVIEVCTSNDNSDPRRKPNAGMLTDVAEKYKVDLCSSYFIGDSIKDIGAGKKAGVKTILLQTDYNLAAHGNGDFNCHSLSEVPQLVFSNFTQTYLNQASEIINRLNIASIDSCARTLRQCRDRGGRLFIIGSGGGAGHASHAVCDFRKLCGIEAYAPTDNISELTARINDDGWETSLSKYLEGSRLLDSDCLLVFSVGGGSEELNVSMNLVNAITYAKTVGASVVGIVGRDGGFTAKNADACIVVPTVDSGLVTPHTESFQALLWHLLVSHPLLQIFQTKWQSLIEVTRVGSNV